MEEREREIKIPPSVWRWQRAAFGILPALISVALFLPTLADAPARLSLFAVANYGKQATYSRDLDRFNTRWWMGGQQLSDYNNQRKMLQSGYHFLPSFNTGYMMRTQGYSSVSPITNKVLLPAKTYTKKKMSRLLKRTSACSHIPNSRQELRAPLLNVFLHPTTGRGEPGPSGSLRPNTPGSQYSCVRGEHQATLDQLRQRTRQRNRSTGRKGMTFLLVRGLVNRCTLNIPASYNLAEKFAGWKK